MQVKYLWKLAFLSEKKQKDGWSHCPVSGNLSNVIVRDPVLHNKGKYAASKQSIEAQCSI